MSREAGLSQWTDTVSTNLSHLTKPQAMVLARWSFGIACTRTCGRTTVAAFLALLLGRKVGTVEQQLREWCYEATAKAGTKRGLKRLDLDITTCFVPLLRWIVRLWSGTCLALAIDATSRSDRFTILTISVVYRGIGLPVAWTILPATQKHGWKREWLRMVRVLRPAIPSDWTVLVLADRGLYAPWRFRRIVRVGWHPFLRINQGGTFRPAGQARWSGLRELVTAEGQRWRGVGTAFKSKDSQLACTLVAWWEAGHKEPWFVLTDLDADGCDAAWYGLRTWCEQGFKWNKRGGWQWQQTKMTDPARASRLWLALAVATLWVVSAGSTVEVCRARRRRRGRPARPHSAGGQVRRGPPVAVGPAGRPVAAGVPDHCAAVASAAAAGAGALAGRATTHRTADTPLPSSILCSDLKNLPLKGLRPSALRYYESIGLLPAPLRVNGRRRYAGSVVQMVAVIQLAQQAGFSMAEIQTLFHGFTTETPAGERWRALAEHKLAEVNALIQRANVMKQILGTLLECGCLTLDECVQGTALCDSCS